MFLHDQDGSDQRRAGREKSTELLGEEARVGEFQVLFRIKSKSFDEGGDYAVCVVVLWSFG